MQDNYASENWKSRLILHQINWYYTYSMTKVSPLFENLNRVHFVRCTAFWLSNWDT